MNHDVHDYRLPEGASALDRSTLVLWKSWVTWLRPLFLAVAVMTIASAVVGTFIAKSGGFVAVWSPANYAPAVPIGDVSLVQMYEGAWTRGILAQFVSVVVAAAAVWPILRRASRPVGVGALSGLTVVALHLTRSHQWTLEPIVAAPATYQTAALAALWLLPLVTGTMGLLIARRRVPDRDG